MEQSHDVTIASLSLWYWSLSHTHTHARARACVCMRERWVVLRNICWNVA